MGALGPAATDAASASDALIRSWTGDVTAAIDDAVERFQAYARGIIEGATAVFFRIDLPRIRLDLGAIHGALGRWSPDPEEILFRNVERAVRQLGQRAEARLDEEDRTREIDALIDEENVRLPLAALEQALRGLSPA